MGKYVYLEDEEIEDMKILLAMFSSEKQKVIYDKLTQQPKILEELGWVGEKQKKYNILFYSKNVKTVRSERICDSVIFDIEDKTIDGKTIDELEAILNKARELFKEEE